MQNLKSNLIAALIGALICGFIMYKRLNKESTPIEVVNKSSNNSKCIVTKKTDSKGNVTEKFEATSELSSLVTIDQNRAKDNVDLFAGFGINSDKKLYSSVEVILNKHSLEVQSDFKYDHAFFYKYRIIDWQ